MNATKTPAMSGTGHLTALSVIEGGGADLEQRMKEEAVLDKASALLNAAGRGLRDAAYRKLAEISREFLKIDLAAVMVAGWTKYRELIDAGEKTRGNAGVAIVELAGRDLALVRKPTVDVIVGESTIAILECAVQVDVLVAALEAVVRDGALMELTSGSCEITVTFSVGGVELVKQSQTFDPRVVVSLGDGLPLTQRPTE